MNAEALLIAHYEKVADTPNAIEKLRHFILNLAIRGKLVPQNSADGTAEELMHRIVHRETRDKKRHVASAQTGSELREGKDESFNIPGAWKWVNFAEIADFSAGRTPLRSNEAYWISGSHDWVSIADMRHGEILTKTKEKISPLAATVVFRSPPAPQGSILMSFKLTIGKTVRLGVPAFHNEAIIAIRPFLPEIDPYLFITLSQFSLAANSKGAIKGATLNRESISRMRIALPPLAEQCRIVEKFNELMMMCEELEASRSLREATRDRLTTSSLILLDRFHDKTFQNDARFVLSALPALTQRPAQLKRLRETILNLAVQGKLSSLDPNDRSVSEFLAGICALDQMHKTRQRQSSDATLHQEMPPQPYLPTHWQRITLDEVCTLVTSGSRGWAAYYANAGPAFIRAQNIRFGALRLGDLAFVNPPKQSEGSRTRVSPGDLLVVITGAGVTNPALLERDLGEAYVSQHVGLVRPADVALSPWLLLCLMAPMGARSELLARAYGSGKPGLNLDNLRSLPVPLPPLEEQRRIIGKVGAMLSICDQLEENLLVNEVVKANLLTTLIGMAA